MLQKRLDFGSNGYHVPFVPRAARSARKRGSIQKKVNNNQLCAFDLLATVAGKILLEGETSYKTPPPAANVSNIQDIVMDDVQHCDRGSTEAASSPPLTLELGIRGLGVDLNEMNCTVAKIDLNVDGRDSHSIEDPEIVDGKSPTLDALDGSVKLTLGNDPYPCRDNNNNNNNNVTLVSRDDDENSSECIQPITIKTARSPPRPVGGDRRVRKLLESKHRRIASKCRDGDVTDTEVRCLFRNRRICYKRPKSQRIYPFKRRRCYRHSSLSSSHADVCYKTFDSKASVFSSLGVNGSSTCVAGQSTNFSSRESHVKLRIKSFRVPELFIEMPESATIGSLKRTVMEAVSALLGGGLRVGVLLQGKKIRDDNRTLVQTGICHNKAESLGFSLEPNPSSPVVAAPVCSEENSLVLATSVLPHQPISRSPIVTSVQQGTSLLSADHLATNNVGNLLESDYDSAPSPTDFLGEKATVDSRAVVSLPNTTPQALAVVHSHQKSKQRADLGQRRIRRPFSVTEVEALVHAVEKLGTGRWRDVKIRAFDNVKYRTYVDLKDKWKTLVHTASIAPQQRRGEPVPQELLDRVLDAHAYWTVQQSKQQPRQPPSETRRLL